MGQGEDVPGDALRLFLHQLFLLLVLLLQGSQPGRLLPLEELTKLLKLLSDLILCGLGLILTAQKYGSRYRSNIYA